MRIRTIKPEFFIHHELHRLEKDTGLPVRVAFIGLWCAADREGRFKWDPMRLGVQILPYETDVFSRVLDALVTRGFLVKYASQSGEIGVIPSFKKHQIINNKERPSDLPEPATSKASNACRTRRPRVDHACHKEGKGREQGKEGNIPATSAGDSEPSRHHQFIAKWIEAYGASHEVPYKFQDGKDAAAVKSLLQTGIEIERLIEIARKAWALSGFWSKQAASIHGFSSRFNDICTEVIPKKPVIENTNRWEEKE